MDFSQYFRFLFALIFVIGLIGVIAVMVRRMGFGSPTSIIKRHGERRLDIVEVMPLEGRRKLMIIRRDNREHLLMISPASELLIESFDKPATTDITPSPPKHSVPNHKEVK